MFPPCPRGPGRPKKKRDDGEKPRKKRGRPLGARNKKTMADEALAVFRRAEESADTQLEALTDFRMRAEKSADPELEEIDQSWGKCRICNFDLHDPIKKHKKQTICRDCNFRVHEPCLLKDGCTCSNGISY